tara:strand:+ start:492 stop:965 length:474 start_codon:yes stop_codon:yes gene_type:complete
MPLWGNNDGSDLVKTFSGTSGQSTITMSADVTGDCKVGEVLVLDSDGTEKEHRITKISANGLTVTITPALTATYGAGSDVYVRQPPKFESAATIHSGVILGASEAETQHATPGTLTHAGWVKKHTKTRGGVTSVWYETLVAHNSITGDAEATDGLGA